MNELINTFNERRGDLFSATLQHIQISIIALLIAMAIAIPLAIWVVRYKKIAEIFLQITGVLQTIPSLALLALFIPIVGIGTTPAIIALVIYALLPIFQNTYIGLSEIDPSLEEAATAFGMSRTRKLFKVELPIALPVIISGIRTAMVLIIGTATLAALIGAGGLGTFILLGIDRNNTALIVIGAVSSALLAIVFNLLILLLQKIKLRYTFTLIGLLIAGVAGYTGYQAVAQPKATITIAGKLGSEPDVLINMYKLLIEQEDPNIDVNLKPNFGKTTFLFSALKNKDIDIYPEFSGTVLESLVKQDKKQSAKSLTAEKTYTQARDDLSSQFKMSYLKPMIYENTYAIAVKESFAKQNNLKNISDLAKIEPELNAGFTLEFIDRDDGYKGLQSKYGLSFKANAMEPSLRYEAINNGNVNLVDAYSTDSELRQYHLQLLTDNQHLFPPYQGAPLMRTETLKKYPKLKTALDKLAGKITEKQMQEMNYQVNVKNQPAEKVAKDFLVKQGLLREAK